MPEAKELGRRYPVVLSHKTDSDCSGALATLWHPYSTFISRGISPLRYEH